MGSYSATFDDAHRQANTAFDEWKSAPSPERKARAAAATRKWVLMLEPVIGYELAIEYENSVVGLMESMERHQTLLATPAAVQATDASASQILSEAQQEQDDAHVRFDVAIDTTARALINAELRDLVGARKNSHMTELEADEPIVMYWRVQCPYTKMPAMCAGFEVETGAEIRVLSDNWIISTKLFQGSDARDAMDAYAALALEELLKKGYTELRRAIAVPLR